MRHHGRDALALAIAAAFAVIGTQALTQTIAPTNSAPNPYQSMRLMKYVKK